MDAKRMGDSPINGTFMGEVRMRVKGNWKENEMDKIEQLKEGVVIELKMREMIGKGNVVLNENIDIDFNEEKDDIMERTARSQQ